MPIDARGVRVDLERPPVRVVSLVPSTTRTVFDLGAGERLVGVTRFCVSPPRATELPKVGGTKDVDVAAVLALAPDLVLANCEENTAELLTALDGRVPVWAAFPRDVDGALLDLRDTGALLGLADAVRGWVARAEAARDALATLRRPGRTAACLIWRGPWMAVGGDTFASAVMAEAGLRNVFADRPVRYPAVTPDALAALDPDLVLLPTEPFPFRARHAHELAQASGLPLERFVSVDGQALTWHGTRLVDGLAQLADGLARGFPALPT